MRSAPANRAKRQLPAWAINACGALLVASSGVGWYLGVVHPIVTASTREKLLREKRDVLASEVALLTKRRDNRVLLVRGQEQSIESSSVKLRPPSALNLVVADISRLARDHSISLQQIEPGAAKDTPLAVQVPVRLEARGASPAAVRFLAALRVAFPDVAVDGFDVSRKDSKDSDTRIGLNLTWYADRAAERTAVVPTAP